MEKRGGEREDDIALHRMLSASRIALTTAFSVTFALKLKSNVLVMTEYKKLMIKMPKRYTPVISFFLTECCSNSTSFIKEHASMTFGFDTR